MSLVQGLDAGVPLRFVLFQEIRSLIVAGMLLPGQQLRDEELAGELGVSRGPVREAFQLLEYAGWAEIRPRSGAFVREPSVEENNEVFELRTILEEHSARMAAERATEQDLIRLAAALEESNRELARDDTHRRDHARVSIHSAIRQIAGNTRIRELTADLDARIAWCFVPLVRSRREQALLEHDALVRSITQRDPDRAARLARQHSEDTQQIFLRLAGVASDGDEHRPG